MAGNAFAALKALVAAPTPLWVGTVVAHNGEDGTSTLTLPGGAVIRARGQSVAVGGKAFVQGGEVRGEAPALNTVTLVVY
jgi:hypothetical protein